ncbi:hypothetical protein C1645_831613 [Glomus cerebriforme]|uniref:Uncharacterized protein n=1 Tax=Glomus cerebriforme TaxID=658196 RepID=A0A397SH61_9GLOM|nr:hypothetical protein C1645_831613 [Glomus cerebriforme]
MAKLTSNLWSMAYNRTFLIHKARIQIGNFNIQKCTLAALAPFLSSAKKSNYTQSVAHFFGILERYSKLVIKLQCVSSFKVSEEKRSYFLTFDEALKTFGVKFVKQNVTGNIIDSENLKHQVKAA